LDLRINQLDVPAEILTTRASFLPYNPKLAYAAADISANVTALELWASYLITYGVSAPGCSTGTLGPFGGGLGISWWWARADVVPTVMAAISSTIAMISQPSHDRKFNVNSGVHHGDSGEVRTAVV